MANKRVYYAQAATVNTTGLGGTTDISVEIGYENVLQAQMDGLGGVAKPDRITRANKGTIASEDVKKFLTLLNSTASEMTWFGRESGVATFGKGTIDDPKILGGSLNIAKSGAAVRYAGMVLNWEALHAAADDFDDVFGHLDAQSAPPYVAAERLADPIGMVFGAATILHPSSLSISVQPVGLLREFGDSDEGITAIDIPARAITGTIGFQDTTKQTGPPTHQLAMLLLKASRADLATTVRASAGVTNQLITLKNCDFTRYRGRVAVRGYWEHQLEYVLGWLDDDDTVRSLGGANPIMTIANV